MRYTGTWPAASARPLRSTSGMRKPAVSCGRRSLFFSHHSLSRSLLPPCVVSFHSPSEFISSASAPATTMSPTLGTGRLRRLLAGAAVPLAAPPPPAVRLVVWCRASSSPLGAGAPHTSPHQSHSAPIWSSTNSITPKGCARETSSTNSPPLHPSAASCPTRKRPCLPRVSLCALTRAMCCVRNSSEDAVRSSRPIRSLYSSSFTPTCIAAPDGKRQVKNGTLPQGGERGTRTQRRPSAP